MMTNMGDRKEKNRDLDQKINILNLTMKKSFEQLTHNKD